MDDPTGFLIEAEDFADHGGWVMDSQFEVQMGSPYLLAHGLGRPVADATTTVDLPAGRYDVWVRTKDWAPPHGPGRFTLTVGATTLATVLGVAGETWAWQPAGPVAVVGGPTDLVLHDLTGFDGRCDAVYLSADGAPPVDGADAAARAWRQVLRGLPAEPVDAGAFDVVVVGGGIAGCAATLAAARHGARVALVQDRPVLGGNASREIGLSPRGETGGLVGELSARTPDGDLVARQVLEAEPDVSVFVEQRVVAAATDGAHITSIDVRDARSGAESRFTAPVFVDCTGTAILGLLSGAEILSGQEARSEHDEPSAPEERDDVHHGNTLFFRTRMAEGPVPFPDVPWAVEVSRDYANLSGQLMAPGFENGPGPIAGRNPDDPAFQFGSAQPAPGVDPVMTTFPATHFWEYGQWLDLYTQGEEVRDHLLRALYGTFSNVKRSDPEAYAALELEWIAFVAAQGEFNRYRGDHVLTENDIRHHVVHPDAIVQNDGAFCIHVPFRPGEGAYDFRLKDWVWDMRDDKPYGIPFRCLYSATIDNLLVAGKHISVTRVAGSTTKLMGNGGQHGAAVGVAAALCVAHGTTPRGIYEDHLDELRAAVDAVTGCRHEEVAPPAPLPTARATAERHAADVVAGDMAAVTADFHGQSFMRLLAVGALPPMPTTAWEVVEASAGDEAGQEVFVVRYDGASDESLSLRTTWSRLAGRWMIVAAEPIAVPGRTDPRP